MTSLDDIEVSLHREKALTLFKLNKNFLESIENANKENISSTLDNISQDQLLTLIYLFFFVYKKEIPILKTAQEHFHARQYKKIIKTFSGNKLSAFLNNDEEMRNFISGFYNVLPFLVLPILNDC